MDGVLPALIKKFRLRRLHSKTVVPISGSQCVVQLKIILSTGSISYSQIVSLPVSIFSDAYFIQRGEDNSDPDPELKMVAMRIFPWMLIVVIHSITVWTCIAALLGEYVIPCILASLASWYLLICRQITGDK